ncbi:metal-dependent hydrolase [Amycolatopsis antarctica]|uniref:Metal-dependent hydrolase n=1 Tax=Amycolatopsis antarctica TaxID=1854586 RepID=A0A263D8J7_9PSEU|nr:metal-dependent hydrolase [Amycolatopsis antarctica]OZM74844.1 metal-dependent hydrolase [Amycolatopsis antarctica]
MPADAAPAGDHSADDHSAEPEEIALRARDVHFDWSALPMHWIPGDPFATHVINVLHLLLPEGEEFFVRVFGQALPLIEDEKLREDVLGFIGQEAVHAKSHQGVLDHFDAHGLDTRPYTRQIAHLFGRILGDRGYTGRRQEEWLVERVALIAGIEHITAFLGQWILDARALDEAGADPTMLDLLRWHGSEEVEHRAVAYDLYQHLDGRYFRRVRLFLLAAPFFFWLWVRGTRYLLAHDPRLGGRVRPRLRDLMRTRKHGLTPGFGETLRLLTPYFRRSYHPSQHGSTSQAIAYLADSPAAQAGER